MFPGITPDLPPAGYWYVAQELQANLEDLFVKHKVQWTLFQIACQLSAVGGFVVVWASSQLSKNMSSPPETMCWL